MPGAWELVGREPRCCRGPAIPLRGTHGCWHLRERRLRSSPSPASLAPGAGRSPDTSVETPWWSAPPSTHSPPCPWERLRMDLVLPAGTSPTPALTPSSSPGCWPDLKGDKSRARSRPRGAKTQRLGVVRTVAAPHLPRPQAMHRPWYRAAGSRHFSKCSSSPSMPFITLFQLTDLNH